MMEEQKNLWESVVEAPEEYGASPMRSAIIPVEGDDDPFTPPELYYESRVEEYKGLVERALRGTMPTPPHLDEVDDEDYLRAIATMAAAGADIAERYAADQIVPAIDDWLDAHPEATTTVEDGAVTAAKIADGSITDAKLATSNSSFFQKAVTGRAGLNSSSDMNSVIQAGYYFKDNSVEVTNGVNSHRAKIICFNSPAGEQYGVVQLWFDCVDGKAYFRTKSYPAASWTEWRSITDNNDLNNVVMRRDPITAGTDMNSVNTPGNYFKDGGVSVTNAPPAANYQARIVVFTTYNNSYGKVQLWFNCVTNEAYFRCDSGGGYKAWKKVESALAVAEPSASDCISAFVSAMNAMAAKVGMTDTTATSPSGLSWDGRTTAKDLLRLATVASGYDRLCRIWGKKSHTINYYHGGTLTSTTVTTSVANETLEASYHIIGGKTGSSYEDEGQSDAINNLVMIASDSRGRAVVGSVVEANGMTNRFNAMKSLLDNAFAKLDDPSATPAAITTAECAIAWALPPYSGSMCEGYDLPVLYSQNPTISHGTASTIKVLTAITALDILTNEDLQTWYTMTADDIIGGSGAIFSSGDKVKIIDLFYAMMLPSSNMSAQAIAHYCGKKILLNTGA